MEISTFHITRITLNKLNMRLDCKGMNFRAIPENWPKVKFSKILQNSTPSSYCYANFTGVFVGEFPIKTDSLGHLIQPVVRIAVQPKNHKPENQNELMGVPLIRKYQKVPLASWAASFFCILTVSTRIPLVFVAQASVISVIFDMSKI